MNATSTSRKLLPFLTQTIRSSVFSNSISLIILRGSTTATRILVLFIIARFSVPEEFGLISYAIAVTEIAEVIADFGIDTLAIREFAIMRDEADLRTFAKTVAVAKLLCTTIIYGAVVLFFWSTLPSTQIKICIAASFLLFTALAGTFSINYFQARLQIHKILWPVLLNNLVTLAAIALLFAFHPVSLFAVAVLPLAEAVNDGILLRMLFKDLNAANNLRGITKRLHWASAFALLRRTSPIALTNIIVVLYTRLDVVVLSAFLGQSAVGYYGIAFRMTEPFQLIAVSFAASLYSHMSMTIATNQQAIGRVAFRYLLGVLIYGLLSCLLLIVVAPRLVEFLLPRYMPAVAILQILAVALVFRTINTSLTGLIQAYGHFSQITGVAVWNLVLISVALLILVPRMGAPGAALALLIGEIINTLLQCWLVKRAMSTHVVTPVIVENGAV